MPLGHKQNVAPTTGETPPSALPSEEHYAHDLLTAADTGMALYDAELRLLAINERYRDLVSAAVPNLVPGRALAAIMDALLVERFPEAEGRQYAVQMAIDGFEPGSTFCAEHVCSNGQSFVIRRRRMSNGTVVETVRPMTNEALVESTLEMAEAARSQLTQALDAMADGLALWNADDELVVFNQNYVDLNPHISDLIKPGARFEDMLRTGIERGGLITADPEAELRRILHLHQNPGQTFEIQIKDGRWVQLREDRTADGGIIGTRTDVTHIKQRELELTRVGERLRRQGEMFDTALNNMIQGLCMFDEEQRLIVANQRYLDLYGFSADVVKPGIKLREIMEYSISLGNYTEEDAAKALAARPVQAGEVQRSTIKQFLRDGRVIAVMNEPMATGGSIATYQDVTDLERSQERLVDYTKKLERSNRELQDFAYVASHDLQEPLRKIEAFGDRLAKQYGADLPQDGQRFIDRMQDAAGRMRQLINDLLDYSRIATKGKPFAKTDLGEVLDGVLSDIQMRIEDTRGRVDVGPLAAIEADPTQMRQLLQTLVANALKFRRPDVDPIVTVTSEFLPGGREIVLVVSDNGIGFEDQYKDQIFTIFQRLHGRSEYEGTGVGLATTRKIVERHGGTIDAKGVPNVGATFTIRLPVEQPVGASERET